MSIICIVYSCATIFGSKYFFVTEVVKEKKQFWNFFICLGMSLKIGGILSQLKMANVY